MFNKNNDLCRNYSKLLICLISSVLIIVISGICILNNYPQVIDNEVDTTQNSEAVTIEASIDIPKILEEQEKSLMTIAPDVESPMVVTFITSSLRAASPGVEPAVELVTESVEIQLKAEPVLFTDIIYQSFTTTKSTREYLKLVEKSFLELDSLIASEEYTIQALDIMKMEYNRLQEVYAKVQADLNREVAREADFYYAIETFEFLKQAGYNDAVACGIIGNMMIETSGGTLILNPYIYGFGNNYYGLCQWCLMYYPEAENMSFEQQLDFLLETIEQEFRVFGRLYKTDFTYNDFLAITDPAEAAEAFARVYERCGGSNYTKRQNAAIKAYEYFVTDAQ